MYNKDIISERLKIPFEKAQSNLRKIFEQYGVTKKSIESWIDTSDFYSMLDEYGELNDYGKEVMEKWKHRFGDLHGEMNFGMYMID